MLPGVVSAAGADIDSVKFGLIEATKNYLLNYQDYSQPMLSGLLDLILIDDAIDSRELESISDALADISSWLVRCTNEMNARTVLVARREKYGREGVCGGPPG